MTLRVRPGDLSRLDLSQWIGPNGTNGATNLTTPGIALCVMRGGEIVYQAAWGTNPAGGGAMQPSTVISVVDSASKFPAMACLLRLCDAGTMDVTGHTGVGALDSSIIAQRPDWATYSTSMGLNNGATNGQNFLTGTTRRNITLRQMMNHIGSFEFAKDPSLADQTITTEQSAIYCMATDPGTLGYAGGRGSSKFLQNTQFVYGGNDYMVLGAIMAHRYGQDWPTTFDQTIVQPLGISAAQMFYPAIQAGAMNPWPADYLCTDAVSYCQLLQTLLNGGIAPNGTQLLSPAAVAALLADGNPNNLPITFSPYDSLGLTGYKYAGGLWIEPPTSTPSIYSDTGFSGVTPWVDFTTQHCACVALNNNTTDAGGNSNGFAISRAIKAYLQPLLRAYFGAWPAPLSRSRGRRVFALRERIA